MAECMFVCKAKYLCVMQHNVKIDRIFHPPWFCGGEIYFLSFLSGRNYFYFGKEGKKCTILVLRGDFN